MVFPNIHMHPNPTSNQAEMSIAIHPLNPDIVLIGCNTSPVSITLGSQGWYYTPDGGASWKGSDTLPTHTDFAKDMADPAVGIDLDGNLFFNSVYSGRFAIVARSTDSGTSWNEVILPNTGGVYVDKFHFAIDVNPGSPFKNRLYSAYSDHRLSNRPVRFSRSTDGGISFASPFTISGTLGTRMSLGVSLSVGPNGELYGAWGAHYTNSSDTVGIGFSKSTNGGLTWQIPRLIRNVRNLPATISKGGNAIRVFTWPSMAVDRSTGPRRGWIYMVYAEPAPITPQIFLIHSTNGGTTWNAPKRLNQNDSGKDQLFPSISIDPITGHLYVVYIDSRNFPANDSAQIYISWSPDGGETFEDVLVSDIPFLPAPISTSPNYMGDYIGIAALNGVVWPCWNDNRTGVHQAYTSRIVFVESNAPPKISILPNDLNFGDAFLGRPETLSISVLNMAYPETLLVTDVQSSNPDFTPLATALSVPGAGNQKIKVVFKPLAVGPNSATLTITNNDPRNSVATVNVNRKGICQSLGDMNADATLTPLDVVLLLNCSFLGTGNCFNCFADVNCDGALSASDVMLELNAAFLGEPFPCQ